MGDYCVSGLHDLASALGATQVDCIELICVSSRLAEYLSCTRLHVPHAVTASLTLLTRAGGYCLWFVKKT